MSIHAMRSLLNRAARAIDIDDLVQAQSHLDLYRQRKDAGEEGPPGDEQRWKELTATLQNLQEDKDDEECCYHCGLNHDECECEHCDICDEPWHPEELVVDSDGNSACPWCYDDEDEEEES